MKSVRAHHVSLAVTATVLVALVVGAGCTSTTPYAISTWEEVLFLYAEAKSTTADPFLGLDPAEGSATKFVTGTSLTEGVDASVARIQGQAPSKSWTFELAQPLPQNYYLNLSKAIGGVVWFTDSVIAASEIPHVQLRAEIFNGKTLVGGAEFTWPGGEQIDPWIPFYFKIRPETPVLVEGEKMSLRLTRLSGGFDLAFGTHGAQQTLLEFHYFNFDPLSSAVYLEGRKQVFAASDDPGLLMAHVERLRAAGALDGDEPATYFAGDPEDANPAALLVVGALGLPFLGLVAPRRGARLRGLLLPLLLVAAVFSGCLTAAGGVQDDPQESGQPKPTASVSFEKNETLVAKGHGAVKGWVRDVHNISISDAHISLLGTSNFAKTNKTGRFNFPAVAPGVYLMRVDHLKHLPLEKDVEVRVGEITHVNITLTKPTTVGSNQKEHVHDDWGDDVTFTYPAVSFPLASVVAQTNDAGVWVQPYYSVAATQVPLPFDQVIRPGTGIVEVTLRWTGGPRELGLRITSPVSNVDLPAASLNNFVPRKSGESFRMAVFPNEADPGHQKFTNWVFFIIPPTASTYMASSAPPLTTGGMVNLQLTIHKSVVPLEPSHRDMWNGAQELQLFEKRELKTSYLPTKTDYPDVNIKWVPDKNHFIPPGTLKLEGEFEWANWNGLPLQTWGLAYKPANQPPGKVQWKPIALANPNGPKSTFTMVVDSKEVDQFYQFQSNWYFAPDDKRDHTGSSSSTAQYEQKWFLTLKAIRDPNFVD